MKRSHRLVPLLLLVLLPVSGLAGPAKTLFPTDLPGHDWVQFHAQGFPKQVSGVVYRKADPVTCGMALGGIDTGCVDLETSGLLGYCTIFNTHVPRRGPINLPILGLSVGGKTWVLCDKQPKDVYGPTQIPVEPVFKDLKLDGVQTADEIHYWGHYPVADIEFDTSAPISVGVRAWNPFLPGDVKDSMIPGFVLEVHLRNRDALNREGTIAFSFPGPTLKEAGSSTFDRRPVSGSFTGVAISPQDTRTPMTYAIGAIGNENVRTGGELGAEGGAWAKIATALPTALAGQPGASVAVDFSLPPGKEKVVRFALTWRAATWNNVGYNWAEKPPAGIKGEPRTFTHMHAKYYPDAVQTAQLLAKDHISLLKRVLAWQQVVYSENKLPIWLKDSLINNLYMFTEDGMWAQAKSPIGQWCKESDGLFGMNESPRTCPQIECIPCSFYGNVPLVYFFPELALSTLRGYKAYQLPNGAAPWIFGGQTNQTPAIDFAYPSIGYQWTTNGISLAAMADRFIRCYDTPDKKLLKEFYEMVKSNMIYTVNLRSTPSYSIGERIISMPDGNAGAEWFEAAEPGWYGMVSHAGGLHLGQLRIAERMANEMGDEEFAKQCEDWLKAGMDAMEKNMWTGSHYLNCFDPETGKKSDLVFAHQLDGEWVTWTHGLPGVFKDDRVKTTLETVKKCNVALSKSGVVNYARADGTPASVGGYGSYSCFVAEALMLSMDYMYSGQKSFGVDLAAKVLRNITCNYGYTWDSICMTRGDEDTGERMKANGGAGGNDYYQFMMLWSLPAALDAQPLDVPTKKGGLVYRIIEAAKKQQN